jgi:hypothetical protein
MKGKYRVYVLGEVPKDLRERISELHATAILQAKESDNTVQRSEDNKDKVAFKVNG